MTTRFFSKFVFPVGFFILSVLFAPLTQAQAQKSPAPAADAVLATVGDARITLKDFNIMFDRIARSAVNPPTKEQFLEDLIRMEAGVQEAKKTGKDKDPRMQQAIKQAMYAGYLELELGEKIQNIPKATNDQLKEFYSRNPEIRFSYILIDVKPNATAAEKAQAKKRADEILAEVKSSKRPFAELVKLYSDDPLSKAREGDAGWQRRSTLFPGSSYYDQVLKLKKGEVSGVIETPNGFHIVQATDRRNFDAASIAMTRVEWYEEQKVNRGKKFTDELRAKYKVTINKELLAAKPAGK